MENLFWQSAKEILLFTSERVYMVDFKTLPFHNVLIIHTIEKSTYIFIHCNPKTNIHSIKFTIFVIFLNGQEYAHKFQIQYNIVGCA